MTAAAASKYTCWSREAGQGHRRRSTRTPSSCRARPARPCWRRRRAARETRRRRSAVRPRTARASRARAATSAAAGRDGRPRQHHRDHLQQQRRGQHRAPPRTRASARASSAALRASSRFRVHLRIAAHGGAVSGTRHGREQLLRATGLRGVEAHARRLGREIDVGRDAGQAVERLLDARRAGRARHAGQAELDAFGGGERPYFQCRRRRPGFQYTPTGYAVRTGCGRSGRRGTSTQSPMRLYERVAEGSRPVVLEEDVADPGEAVAAQGAARIHHGSRVTTSVATHTITSVEPTTCRRRQVAVACSDR